MNKVKITLKTNSSAVVVRPINGKPFEFVVLGKSEVENGLENAIRNELNKTLKWGREWLADDKTLLGTSTIKRVHETADAFGIAL